MKYFVVMGAFLSLVLLGCPMQPGINEEEKKMQETLNDLTSATPTAEASPELRGKKYVSGKIDDNKRGPFQYSFATSGNTVVLELADRFVSSIGREYGTYSISGDTLSLDFSKWIAALKNMNREVLVRGTAMMLREAIASRTEQLKDPGLSAEKRAELEKNLADNKARLEKVEARISKGEFTLVDIEVSDERLDTNVEYGKASGRLREAINPVTATLSKDRKTLTLSKMFCGVELKADGEPDFAKPRYLENIVFTLKE